MKPGTYRQFACPQVPSDDWIAAAIAIVHGTTALEMLIERQRGLILSRTQGMMEVLQDLLTTKLDFETIWDLSFGRVLRALESDEVDAIDALAEVALRFTALGCPGRWTATLCSNRQMCWNGRWLLPPTDQISVDSNGDRAIIELRTADGGRHSVAFHRDNSGWSTDAVEQLMQVGVHRPITMLSPHAVPRDMIIEDDFHSIFEFPPITYEMTQPLSAALEILNRHAPEYLGWVERVLRGVLLCRCLKSRTRSSSWMHAPGIILVSCSDNPIEVAEMLVHESCHQYYYLLSRVGAIVDGSDTLEYYSPAVQRRRPLSKILIGYHAFANVLLLYRTFLRNGLAEDIYCNSMEARLSAEVETFEQYLRNNSTLTTIGIDILQPLMEQLHGTQSSYVR